MTVSHACILLACLLPIACAGIAKSRGFGKPRREGGYDNRNPRAWLEQQQGFQARANAAQHNSFEALPVFIAGVLIAEHVGVAQATVDALAVGFIACRLGYIAAYVGDKPQLRSALWMLGLACCVALFFLGA